MKVLFVLINMNLGGTEKSLLNLIEILPKDTEITVLLLEKTGDLLADIPENVKILQIENAAEVNAAIKFGFNTLFLNYLKQFKILKSAKAVLYYLFSKVDKKHDFYYLFFKKQLSKLNESFEYAVAFAGPHHFISNFVLDKVVATKKVQWIHFDVTKIYFNSTIAQNIYTKFDTIVCVSNDVIRHFLNILPELSSKTIVKHNIIPFDKIKKLAKAPITDFDTQCTSILTVGRLTEEKGHLQFLSTFKRLKDCGYHFCWYIIGDGNQLETLQNDITRLELTQQIILLGKKINPYPYYKACTIYLQPSVYEGHCVSILEAKFFKKPIICTNFAGAIDEISNGKNGLIVDFHEDSFYDALTTLLDNESLRIDFSNYNTTSQLDTKMKSFDAFLNS